ncbi:hypothetical protein Bcep1808_7677 (plasmid) [Burkholderia vietnamiensis G4]|uniref:Uncharacterized protein n=1 Tax=Burkholderia vietnamiensis (strain G4 / LMG 22486) TaxID=269482 RepID=A4JW94_BURVG|nr:hypothetical protein Bcep1808_7677 [Burkholderia vietnamiensis G4]
MNDRTNPVESKAAQAAEPVTQWQYRTKVTTGVWSHWHNCKEAQAQRLREPEYATYNQVRALYDTPRPTAQADYRGEDAYVTKRLSEALASVYTTLIGDDKADVDENMNAFERVERAAQVIRLEVELYRGQADAREGLTADDVSELKGMTSDPRLFEAEREAIRKAVALLQGANQS